MMDKRLETEDVTAWCMRLYRERYGLSVQEIADTINKEMGTSFAECTLRKKYVNMQEGIDYSIRMSKDDSERPRLVISDLHLPFAVDGWLDFIKEVHAKHNCHDEIIINGDLLDFHVISAHDTETDAESAINEFHQAQAMVAQLVEAFPQAIWLTGNHDDRISRGAKVVGIDKIFIKSLPELFELPKTWRVITDIIIDGVYYRHVGCAGGMNGARNSAIANGMSTVVSHLHAFGGVSYVTDPMGRTKFGLNTGCLMDDEGYHARYGQLTKQKGTIGCGVVYNDTEAYFVPMK